MSRERRCLLCHHTEEGTTGSCGIYLPGEEDLVSYGGPYGCCDWKCQYTVTCLTSNEIGECQEEGCDFDAEYVCAILLPELRFYCRDHVLDHQETPIAILELWPDDGHRISDETRDRARKMKGKKPRAESGLEQPEFLYEETRKAVLAEREACAVLVDAIAAEGKAALVTNVFFPRQPLNAHFAMKAYPCTATRGKSVRCHNATKCGLDRQCSMPRLDSRAGDSFGLCSHPYAHSIIVSSAKRLSSI